MGPTKSCNIKEITKKTFFSYSSPDLYNINISLGLMDNRVSLVNNNSKFVIKLRSLVKTFVLILIGISIKSLCQYFFGAEETSIDKIILGLDSPYLLGCIVGGLIMTILRDNLDYLYNLFIELLPKNLNYTMRLDSEDENSDGETIKKVWKGKEKVSDNNDSRIGAEAEIATLAGAEAPPKITKEMEEAERIAVIDHAIRINFYLDPLNMDNNNLKPSVRAYILKNRIPVWGNYDTMPELRTKDFKLSAIKLANDFSENNLKIVEVYISKEQEIIQKLVSMLPHADMYLKTDVQVFDNKKLPKNTEVFFSIIFNEASSENRVLMNRMIWLKSRAVLLEFEAQSSVIEAILRMAEINRSMIEVERKFATIDKDLSACKVWYAKNNEFRNKFSKELNKAEAIAMKTLKKSPFCTFDHSNCKNFKLTINEYNKAILSYNKDSSYLRARIGEILNRPKPKNK